MKQKFLLILSLIIIAAVVLMANIHFSNIKNMKPIFNESVKTKTVIHENENSNNFAKFSDETSSVQLGMFGISFNYPINFIHRGSFKLEPSTRGYSLRGEFNERDQNSKGYFTYDTYSFGYVIKSDNYEDEGGEEDCSRKNVIEEKINNNGLVVIYKHGGEIMNCFSDTPNEWITDTNYAEGYVAIDKKVNGVHFSDISIYNRNLTQQDFKKLLESFRAR